MIRVEVIEPFGEWWDAVETDREFQHWIRPDLNWHRKNGWTFYKATERNLFAKNAGRFAHWDSAIKIVDKQNEMYRVALSSGVWIKTVTERSKSGKLDLFRAEYRGQAKIEFEGQAYIATARGPGECYAKTWGQPPQMTWPWNFGFMPIYGWIEFHALP